MKNYIADIIDLTVDGYVNPTGAVYGDGTGKHQRSLTSIDVIAVHHDAVTRPHDYDSVARIKQETAEHYKRLGPGYQYHYSIDNVGQIFLTRPLTTWVYAVGTEANTRAVMVKLDGYFHSHVSQKPTREQYESLSQLIIYLMTQRPDIPRLVFPNVAPHSSFSSTACCGDLLRPYVLRVMDAETAKMIPEDAVYDWPNLQPEPPISEGPIVDVPSEVTPDKWKQDAQFKPASYVAQVKTHLDGMETGQRFADYEPGWKADFVARFTKRNTEARLLTSYAIEAAKDGKRELAGVPEKDMLTAQVAGSQPNTPSEPDPGAKPPVVEPPVPSDIEKDHEKRISTVEAMVKQIIAFLDKIFKWR